MYLRASRDRAPPRLDVGKKVDPLSALRGIVTPRLVVLLALALMLQILQLFWRLECPAHSAASVLRMDPRGGAALPPPQYEELFRPDRVHYSHSSPGNRDCGAGRAHSPPSPITVVTLVGPSGRKEHPGFINFLKSLEINGYDRLIVLDPPDGTTEIRQLKRTNHSAEDSFWGSRLAAFLSVAEEAPPDDVLLFCDGLDVYFTQSPTLLLERFQAMRKAVVFAAEVLCDTVSCRADPELKDYLMSSAPPGNAYRFLNAGIFMGTARHLVKVLQCALKLSAGNRDDQNAFSMCYRLDKEAIGLDRDSLLFGNVPPIGDLFLESWEVVATSIEKEGEIKALHRRGQPPHLFPVALHFLGMSYRQDLPFVPCQQFLREKYNEFLSMIRLGNPDKALTHIAGPIPFNAVLFTSAKLLLHGMSLSTASGLALNGTKRCAAGIPGLHSFSLLGLEELVEAIVSMLPPRQNLTLGSGSTLVKISRLLLYVEIDATSVPALKSLSQLKQTVEKIISLKRAASSCVLFALHNVLGDRGDLLVDKFVLSRSISDIILASRGAEELSDSSNGIHWALNIASFDSPFYFITFSSQHSYGKRVLSSLLNIRELSPNIAAAYGHIGLLIDWAPSSAFRISPVTLQPLGKISNNAAYMRSSQHWSSGPHAVDILSSAGAVMYEYTHIRNLSSVQECSMIASVTSDCLSPHKFDALLSSHLALMGVPRVQIPWSTAAQNHAVDLLLPEMGRYLRTASVYGRREKIVLNSEPIPIESLINEQKLKMLNSNPSSYGKFGSMKQNIIRCECGKIILKNIQLSWKENLYPIEETARQQLRLRQRSNLFYASEKKFSRKKILKHAAVQRPIDIAELRFCPQWMHGDQSFLPIPSVKALDGFSWKQNWNSASSTSPCTCHLFTRIVDGQFFLGKGHYMGTKQFISSRSGEYILRLDEGLRLCLYIYDAIETGPKKCISVPGDAALSHRTRFGDNNSYYVSLLDGSVCFFRGPAPFFGGTANESWHRDIIWCTDNTPPMETARMLLEAEETSSIVSSSLKSRIGAMMKSICLKLYVSSSNWDNIILFVPDDGSFGIFTSQTCPSSHELCSPEKRTRAVSLLKCF